MIHYRTSFLDTSFPQFYSLAFLLSLK